MRGSVPAQLAGVPSLVAYRRSQRGRITPRLDVLRQSLRLVRCLSYCFCRNVLNRLTRSRLPIKLRARLGTCLICF